MVAGGHWPEIGKTAALKLSGSESAAQSVGVELLSDVKEIFEMRYADRISTSDLISALCGDDEKMWATYNRGNPIRPRQLADKLKGYGINSNTIRIGANTVKGFRLDQFTEAFSRYIVSSPPPTSVTKGTPGRFISLRVNKPRLFRTGKICIFVTNYTLVLFCNSE